MSVQYQHNLHELPYEEQVRIAHHKLAQNGVLRLAVVGPEGSQDDILAKDLGFDEQIEYHDAYEEVITACGQVGVAAVVPMGKEQKDNQKLWEKSGRASIASIRHNGDEASTKLLVEHRA